MAAKVAPRGGAAGLTQRRKTYRILREDTADTLSPLSRTLFELHHEGKSAASSKQLEDVGVTYPEQELARAMSGLSVAIWVGMITTALTHPEVFEESAFTPRLGYSNICIALDTEPAKYISSVLLHFFAYFCIEYARTDVLRSKALWEYNRIHGHKNSIWKYRLNVFIDCLFIASSVTFSGVVLMFAPHHGTKVDHHGHPLEESSSHLWIHTLTFIQWIWVQALLLLSNYMEANSFAKVTRSTKVFFWTYIVLCIVAPTEVIINYAYFDKHGTYLTPPWLNAALDFGWLVMNSTVVFTGLPMSAALVHHPSEPRIFILDPDQKAINEKKDEEELSRAPAAASLLWLLFIPFFILSFLWAVATGAAEWLAARAGLGAPSPLAKAHAALKADPESGARPGRLKFVGAWCGGFFGNVGLTMKPGFKPGELCDRWGHGCAVYAGNVGAPVVFLMDCASSSHGMDPVDNRKAGHHYDVPLLRWRGDQAAAAPNFMRSGKKATATRDFLRAVLPSEAGGERWEAALAVVKARIASWAEYQVEELPHFDIKFELQLGLLRLFVSHLFFAETLDISFIQNFIYPLPQLEFWWPYWPNWLNPAYHTMKAAKASVWDFIRECPRAGEIKAAYDAAGLSETEAFEALLTALTFNAAGAGNSGLNLLYYLPLFDGAGLMKEDDALLTSFCYELLRNNGPPAMFKMGFKDRTGDPEDFTVVRTSKGEEFAIANGTWCYINSAVLGRDEAHWEDPHTFRADRFVPLAPAEQATRDPNTGVEPRPSVAMGCPLGKSEDEAYLRHAHCCVFMHLIVPFLKALTLELLDYDYRLDRDTESVLKPLVKEGAGKKGGGTGKCPFAFNISADCMKGGVDLTEDCTPPVGMHPTVVYFNRK